jgi:WD40 repeat protein
LSVAYSPDGTRIVTASNDKMAKVWDSSSGAFLFDLKGVNAPVVALALSPDGTRIVTGELASVRCLGEVRFWDARTGTEFPQLERELARVSRINYSPDGKRLLITCERPDIQLWDATTASPIGLLEGHVGFVMDAAFSSDGKRIVSGGYDQTVRVWDGETGAGLMTLIGHAGLVSRVAFSPDGARILSGGWDGTVRVWDARTGTPMIDLNGLEPKDSSVSFSPDGQRILATSTGVWAQSTALRQPGVAKIWEVRPIKDVIELKGHITPVEHVSFSPDGKRIITASGEPTAKIWDTRTGAHILDLGKRATSIIFVRYSHDGRWIFMSDQKGSASVLDAETGTARFSRNAPRGRVMFADFSPEDTRLVIGYGDWTSLYGSAEVCDARTGQRLLDLPGAERVLEVYYSADGRQIVANPGGRVKVWDAETGRSLEGETIPAPPRHERISPDGGRIALSIGNRVELIPLKPDADELARRRLVMQVNPQRYREAYLAATKANDALAARFYLNLSAPAERARTQAQSIVVPLFARLLLRQDVLAALSERPAADPELQSASVDLAASLPWAESANTYNNAGWELVRDPGHFEADYERGLRLAQAACQLQPDNRVFLNTLGAAQYRSGLLAEAVATLERSNRLNEGREPSDLAFLTLALHRLGQSEKADATLGRLRELMKNSQSSADGEAQALLREAETIELDRAFPADPFAR